MAFETLPVVHVERRRFPEYPDAEPERVLTELTRRFGRLVLVDTHGVRANDPDVEFLQEAARRRSVWADGGSRYATDAMDLFIAGADTVTLRWNTLHKPSELEEAARLCQPGTLLVGLEFPRGKFLPHRRDPRDARDVVRLAEELGAGVVYILDAPDANTLRALPPATTRYAQGAPATLHAALQEMGFAGALVAPSELSAEAPP